nr:hypothetical protein [Tanacetum cinerariifolium]
TMADVNVNAYADQAPTMAPPTCTDDQILPHIRWVPIGKSNCYLDIESKHKFHLRPNYPLHLPNEEPVLGYLKFNAKGTKREVFTMPIPNKLIAADIQGSDPDSPAPKPSKATKKSKPSAPRVDLRPSVTKPASSQQPKPKPAPAKPQKKKRKLVTKTSDKPSLAKRSKPGLVTKRRKPTSSLRSVDMSVNEEVDIQRAVEESLNSVHDAHQGLLPSMVIREPDPRKYQPLLEVQRKGKEKVSDEQVARDLLTLQMPKKSSKSEEDVPPVVEVEAQDEGQAGSDIGVLSEGQAGSNPGVLTEGQAGSDLGVLTEGQVRSDPDDDAESQSQSSPVVHAGPNIEHMHLEAMDVSTQLHPEKMDKGFTATAYPNVQENLILTVEEHVILEQPASSTGTLSSLQHLAQDFIFGDLFFNDKPSEA